MRLKRIPLAGLTAALASAAILGSTSPARADDFGWGLVFGALVAAPFIASTYYWPYYYPPYYPAYPYYPPYAPYPYAPTYVAPYSAPAYVEQRPAQSFWYYCPGANAYYPYVRECPGGWQRVSPTPPGL